MLRVAVRISKGLRRPRDWVAQTMTEGWRGAPRSPFKGSWTTEIGAHRRVKKKNRPTPPQNARGESAPKLPRTGARRIRAVEGSVGQRRGSHRAEGAAHKSRPNDRRGQQ